MIFQKKEAIIQMDRWGLEKIPFLFVIDFEMKAIRLHRTDLPLPGDIRYAIGNSEKEMIRNFNGIVDFKKEPMSPRLYKNAFDTVQQQIKAGNSFLVNLTFPTDVATNLSLSEIFEFSKAKYRLLVEDQFVVFSPETFVTIKDGVISSFPMKGTIDASLPDAKEELLNSCKETAEHHTMVDLIRNDLSKISTDVAVKRFRFIDEIDTNQGNLLQVSSEITGKLSSDFYKELGTLFFELLPAGSITGAPKDKTVTIIRQVETSDRGYYSGVFGHFDGRNLESAVMIRFIGKENGHFRFRSGGGITSHSRWEDEYHELIQKVYVPII